MLGPVPKSPTCHSEGAERPKNLINTKKYEILRCAQDDNMALRRALNPVLGARIALPERQPEGQGEQLLEVR
jgi:hypothetical protein